AIDFSVQFVVEFRGREGGIDVGSEFVGAVYLVFATFINEQGVTKGGVEREDLVKGRPKERDIKIGESAAVAELIEPAGDLAHEAHEAGRIDVDEIVDAQILQSGGKRDDCGGKVGSEVTQIRDGDPKCSIRNRQGRDRRQKGHGNREVHVDAAGERGVD